jgi:predicted helicase
MIGLYLLTTKQLEKDGTIKFGMSMRIESRWIDYLAIFSDSRYIYYYEFLDKLSRQEILVIEDEILELHKNERNEFFQTEYFYCKDNKIFHESIINVLNKHNIKYKIHDTHNFDRKYYDNNPDTFEPNAKSIIFKNSNIKKIFNKINISNFKNILKFSCKNKETNEIIIPREHQINILLKIDKFYNNNNIGKLIHCCGLGKALLGIFIVKKLNCKSVVIGVPSIYLQKQMKNEIMRIYNNHKNILYIGGETEKNENYTIESTTKEDDINKFINNKSSDCKFIITTYDSCNKLINHNFDFKIGDEAHHLVGSEFEKTKDSFHKIKSNKSLFMTATEKLIENNKTNKVIYSMNDENIFGKIIDVKSINWAIENKKITDYYLVILKNTEDEINNIINSLNLSENKEIQNSIIHHKNLFLSAFMSLKSIENYTDLTHILIYTNKTENSELIKKYIDYILELNIININKENYYNKALHSKSLEFLNDIKLLDGSIKEGEISKFKKASWGIISSVYIFSEGFDCPKLNGVIFAENMDSDIRIVQSTLRPNRLDINFPDKKAYVIIPYIDTKNFITDNESFDKCRKIITKIRNVDEKIEQKINVVSLNKKSSKSSDDPKEKIKYYHIIENGDELTKIMLRLRYSKALGSQYTEEEDEYNYVKELNKQLKIQSKEDYTKESVKVYHEKYIEYIKYPEEYFKGIWKNWYDFIGVNTKKFIQDKNDWINFCKENNVKSLDEYKELSKLYDVLPIDPADFYIGFVSIPIELGLYTKRRK